MPDSFTEVAQAFHAGDASRVSALLEQHPELVARLDDPIPGGSFGSKAMSVAVERRNLAMVDVLIAHGADINARSDWWAGSFGVLDLCAPELAPALVARGATVDAHSAARLGLFDALKELIAGDASLVHARGGDGQTPLHFASTVEIARFLLEHGADIDARDVDHESTPAQWMLSERQDVARYLVTRGCRTDILMAAALGAIDLVRRHIDDDPPSVRTRVTREYFPMKNPRAGGSIYIWTLGNGVSPHVVAKKFGHDDVYALLLERSPADVTLRAALFVGDEALFDAAATSHPDHVRSLAAAEPALLVDAAQRLHLPSLRLLLKAGWPLDARGDSGGTALHHAAWLGAPALVRELLAHGAPVNIRGDQFDMTPLGWAHHGSENSWRKSDGDYAGVIEALVAAGGT
jgi:ankyrin repeat protein